MENFVDYYEILGVRKNSTGKEIELAYKGRRTQYHPDKYASEGADAVEWATVKMQEINRAYEVLSDEQKRKEFDIRHDESSRRRYERRNEQGERVSSSGKSINLEARKRKIKFALEKDVIDFKLMLDDGMEGDDDSSRNSIILNKILLVDTVEECREIIVNNIDLLPFLDDESEIDAINKAKLALYLIAVHSYSYMDEKFYNGLGKHVFSGLCIGVFAEQIKSSLGSSETFDFLTSTLHQADVDLTGIDLILFMLAQPDYYRDKVFDRKKFPAKIAFQQFLSDVRLTGFHNEFIQLIRSDVELVHRKVYERLLREVEVIDRSEAQSIKDNYVSRYQSSHSSNRPSSNMQENRGNGSAPLLPDYFRKINIHHSDSDRIYLYPNIPKAKAVNAIKARPLLLQSPPKNIFLLVDDTVFGGAAEGLVVTESIISFKEFLQDSKYYAYTVPKMRFLPFETDKKKVFIGNDQCVDFTLLHPQTVTALIHALNQYVADYRAWKGL